MDQVVPRFTLSRYRFTLEAQEPLLAPALNKGNMLRGAFGAAFKRIACPSPNAPARALPNRECHACDARDDCPYAAVFDTAPPAGADRLRLNTEIPRPFVVKPPLDATTYYDAGAPLVFDVVLVGRARRYLPFLLLAFEEIGTMGLGLRDERGRRGRSRLVATDAIVPGQPPVPVYDAATRTIRDVETTVTAAHLAASVRGGVADTSPYRPGASAAPTATEAVTSVRIGFLTPTAIKADGRMIDRPAFGHLLRRLRDRVNALGTFYGDGPMDIDFRGLADRADKVQMRECNVRWEDRARFSSHRLVEHDMSGFMGSAVYEGDLDEFVPLLAVSDWIHVGKNATFGHGWTTTVTRRSRQL